VRGCWGAEFEHSADLSLICPAASLQQLAEMAAPFKISAYRTVSGFLTNW
jgi:hypothetical protein